MPHIRARSAEQSSVSLLPQQPAHRLKLGLRPEGRGRRKSDEFAIALTREALALKTAGAFARAIAAALGLSFRRVQTILNGTAFALAPERKPFVSSSGTLTIEVSRRRS